MQQKEKIEHIKNNNSKIRLEVTERVFVYRKLPFVPENV